MSHFILPSYSDEESGDCVFFFMILFEIDMICFMFLFLFLFFFSFNLNDGLIGICLIGEMREFVLIASMHEKRRKEMRKRRESKSYSHHHPERRAL